jgi:hypothetical protein
MTEHDEQPLQPRENTTVLTSSGDVLARIDALYGLFRAYGNVRPQSAAEATALAAAIGQAREVAIRRWQTAQDEFTAAVTDYIQNRFRQRRERGTQLVAVLADMVSQLPPTYANLLQSMYDVYAPLAEQLALLPPNQESQKDFMMQLLLKRALSGTERLISTFEEMLQSLSEQVSAMFTEAEEGESVGQEVNPEN